MTCEYNKKYIAFDSSILAGRIFFLGDYGWWQETKREVLG